nr:beta-1,4-galactosyltransferase 7 isoform X1 [Ciona intestinalis]|eukprot:XP_002121762.1 beta-1,4-galactosyltransferase 7 isoform X1 [Ciona intestinalis]
MAAIRYQVGLLLFTVVAVCVLYDETDRYYFKKPKQFDLPEQKDKDLNRLLATTSDKVLKGDDPAWGKHRLAVIVPYRGAFEELLLFVPHLHKFLCDRRIRHKIFVIHQVDKFRFNRGFLINVGFLLSRDKFDYLAMHDIDLLPINPMLNYSYPEQGPYHLSSPEYHPDYHGRRFIGGILLFTREDFTKVKGMTNGDWGWGGEDNELFTRIRLSKLKLTRASGLTTGRNTFKNTHDESKRPRDKERFDAIKGNQFELDGKYGFHNADYKLERVVNMKIDEADVTIYNVKLHCNILETPWCQTNYTVSDFKKQKNKNAIKN